MLFNLLTGGSLKSALIGIILALPAILLCLTVHEASHGLAAWALGDNTAKRAGRITLDPFSHLDPMGFFCMLLFGFGWARPVPVNISNFKNRRRGMAITAFAGPLSNLLLAFLFILFAIPLNGYLQMHDNTFVTVVSMFCSQTAMLSIGLGVFNLIPVHPFDGSRIVNAILPFGAQAKLDAFYRKYQTILLLAVIAIVWFGGLNRIMLAVWQLLIHLAAGLLHMIGLL